MPIEVGIPLQKDEVLKYVTEEQIFEKYLGLEVNESVFYCNPLRDDKEAGCRYYRTSAGRLRFKDFSKGHNWDCFSVVQFRYNCTFIEALRQIITDFRLNREVPQLPKQIVEYKPKPRVVIQVSIREWEKKDLDWWAQFNIHQGDLMEAAIYPAKAVWLDGEHYRCKKNDPCYIYYFGNGLYKLYFPNRKKKEGRFITNIRLEDSFLQGINLLPEQGDILVYTKSYKDIICLRKFGIYAIAPQSESQTVTLEQHDRLSKRFNNIFSLFDNDSAGRLSTISHLALPKIHPLLFPFTMEKDFSDNVKKVGVEEMIKIIINVKEKYGLQ